MSFLKLIITLNPNSLKTLHLLTIYFVLLMPFTGLSLTPGQIQENSFPNQQNKQITLEQLFPLNSNLTATEIIDHIKSQLLRKMDNLGLGEPWMGWILLIILSLCLLCFILNSCSGSSSWQVLPQNIQPADNRNNNNLNGNGEPNQRQKMGTGVNAGDKQVREEGRLAKAEQKIGESASPKKMTAEEMKKALERRLEEMNKKRHNE